MNDRAPTIELARCLPRARALILAAILGGGCPNGRAAEPALEEPAPAPEPAAEAPAPDEDDAPERWSGDVEIERAEVDEALERGPGAWLQEIEVEPHFEDDAFAGWELVDFETPDPFEEIGLRRGDVVTALNGHGLERPEYLHAVFVDLRAASAIVVEGQRDGRPFEIEIPIERADGRDAPDADPPAERDADESGPDARPNAQGARPDAQDDRADDRPPQR